MAPKVRVEGNRVHLDEQAFVIEGGKNGVYSVCDEYGGKLGTFTHEGKTITPEDYGVPEAPPLLSIVRPWILAKFAQGEPPKALTSKGVCVVTSSAGATEPELAAARLHRAWLKKQPGMKASYLATDPATGRTLTIAIWQSQAHADTAARAAGVEGAPLKSTGVDVFPFLEEP